MKKENKQKLNYSILNTIAYAICNLWKWDKEMFFCCAPQIPINVLNPLFLILLSTKVVEIITVHANFIDLILAIAGLSGALLILNITNNILKSRLTNCGSRVRSKYGMEINKKIIDADYENINNPSGQEKLQKAIESVQDIRSGTERILHNFINIVSSVINVVTYGVFVIMINPVLIVLLCSPVLAEYFINKNHNNWLHDNKDKWIPIDRKINYITHKSSQIESGKDIRLYNMKGWLNSLFEKYFKERITWYKKIRNKTIKIRIIAIILSLFRDGLSYMLLIYKIYFNGMMPSDFVFNFNAISNFSANFQSLFYAVNEIYVIHAQFCDLRDFLNMKDKSNRNAGIQIPEETCEIEFKNVTFYYPGEEKPTIDNMSFKIEKGEKIAIVGYNGSGKTTLIKLLCGLYTPTSGTILVNNQEISKYNIVDYYRIFSTVFQDIYFLPATILKNITLTPDNFEQTQRLSEIIDKSGICDFIRKMPYGIHTNLIKSVNDDAVDISGGEKQRLALARALYKNGKIIILDEPTAALDPLMESKLYMRYNEITDGNTSIYISHRLSSTHFCDRILFINNGRLIETGNHSELIKMSGKYAEMFKVQSQYYS
ncbi:MAG: ABC transporter ATP-binding protein/permease [Oscillospiraceae bacterium]|nr:ABC transporter ATP-binding protein/permease [Oscillospiraceae bacterium]